MTEYEKLSAQAEILEETARWSMQPDQPTHVAGFVSASELRLRAAALRSVAEVLYAGATEDA